MGQHSYKTDLERRKAISRAFDLFPHILSQFALRCELEPENSVVVPPSPEDTKGRVCEIMTAQFAVRLLRSREFLVDVENEALHDFMGGLIARYNSFSRAKLPGFKIKAAQKNIDAMDAMTAEMANMVFQLLAQLPDVDPDFDEPSFWRDVFFAIAETRANNPSAVPNLMPALQAVILDPPIFDLWATVLQEAPPVALPEPEPLANPTRH